MEMQEKLCLHAIKQNICPFGGQVLEVVAAYDFLFWYTFFAMANSHNMT
jgi:hypothetical protein